MNYLNVSRSKRRIAGLFSLGALTLGIFPGTSNQVWAGAGVLDNLNNCAVINCLSQSISGTYLRTPSGQSLPFTTQIYASAGACIRLDVTAQGTDLEMVLVSPNGTAWRNDNVSLVDPTPLIKVMFAPVTGWYNLQVSHFGGFGPPQANFELRYGLYNGGNPNCIVPTPPI